MRCLTQSPHFHFNGWHIFTIVFDTVSLFCCWNDIAQILDSTLPIFQTTNYNPLPSHSLHICNKRIERITLGQNDWPHEILSHNCKLFIFVCVCLKVEEWVGGGGDGGWGEVIPKLWSYII